MGQRTASFSDLKVKILAATVAAAVAAGLVACAGGPTRGTDTSGIDWSKVPATKLVLFYPGKSSYEWLRDPAAHKGAASETARGDSCVSCHDDAKEEQRQGAKILSGKHPLEPIAPPGKPGHVDVAVQAAFDDKNVYLRYQWKGSNDIEYPYYRFDGKEWKVYGGPRLDKPVQEGMQPAIYEARMSLMLDDGKVPMFKEQGCWLTCHEGERDLNPATTDQVKANAAMQAYKKSDVRKYLPASRSDPSDWKTGKSLDEIAKIKAAGGFADLIQWRAHRTNPVGGTDDGYVLEWRNFDAGKNHFASNLNATTKQPNFMFDAAKFGTKAVSADQVRTKDNFLIKGANAVPFDPNAGWKAGDMLPRYVLQPADASGSAADNKGYGMWKDSLWTVVVVRPLNLANPDDKALKPGGVYNVGFALHSDNITTRGHYVSYTKTLGIGAKADIVAVKQP
ncbi:MAG: hypothetical protein HYZ17_10735 [Betaproteobacteria bacterium]|nr:hypothetical protein [Betaproteobacteria bacterium]